MSLSPSVIRSPPGVGEVIIPSFFITPGVVMMNFSKESSVMANTNAPFGFRQIKGTGSAPTYEQNTRYIKSDNSTAIYFGDAVIPLTTGYIAQATASTVRVEGIFAGCKYVSTSQKRTVWSNYWPGSDTSNDVEAYVITDPNARFIVQTANSNTTATAVGQAQVGENIGFNWNDSTATGETNGNTANGLSTMFADQYTLSSAGVTGANAALPFRIIALANYLPGQANPLSGINGNDATSGYNEIVVAFNNAMPRNFAGM